MKKKKKSVTKKTEGFSNKIKSCYYPTKNNPLMNVLPTDNPMRKEACKSYKENINDAVNKEAFSERLYSSLEDGKINFENSMRAFYTCPNSKVPNDQKKFREFLYGDMPSNKGITEH